MFSRQTRYSRLPNDFDDKLDTSARDGLISLPRRALHRFLSRWKYYLQITIVTLSTLVLIATLISISLALFSPVYTNPPQHYQTLATRILESSAPGRGNIHSEKVFIAANVINPDLVEGAWGKAVRELVDILGPENVEVSIYENDSGPKMPPVLKELERSLICNTTIKTGQHIDLSDLSHVRLSESQNVVTRIEYLAEVRNHAILPLQQPGTPKFDKLLFLNDVYFDPVEAAQLLFSTHQDESGRADYQAACAVDFVSITNFYDDYATRDFDGRQLGYGPGFRIFPWYAGGVSRDDVLSGTDAVRVRSCWGGMIAFNAEWFQSTTEHEDTDNRASDLYDGEVTFFRSEKEVFWDASECCLINADISSRYHRRYPDASDAGVFQNPFVRVAYTPTTFRYLSTVMRFEHGFSLLQSVLTKVARYPLQGERRLEEEGTMVMRREWDWSKRRYEEKKRLALPGGFCGRRSMDYMKDDFAEANARNEKSFVSLKALRI